MAMDIELTQGEEKTITFTYADSLDVSTATLGFRAKTQIAASTATIRKVDSDFTTTDAATGIVTVDFDSTDTATPDTLIGELTATFSSTSKDVSERKTIWIKEAV
jgi:hypothetical protein